MNNNNIVFSEIKGGGCGIPVPSISSLYVPTSLSYGGHFNERTMNTEASDDVISSQKFDLLLDLVSVNRKKKNNKLVNTQKNKKSNNKQ